MDIVFGNKTKEEGEVRTCVRYNYRLYPTPEQAKHIELTIDACKGVYNYSLYLHKQHYANELVSLMQKNGLPLEYKELKDGTIVINCSEQCLSLYRKKLTLHWCDLHKIQLCYDKQNNVLEDADHLKSYRDKVKKYISVLYLKPSDLIKDTTDSEKTKKLTNTNLLVQQMNNLGLIMNYTTDEEGNRVVRTTDNDLLEYQTILLIHYCNIHNIPLLYDNNGQIKTDSVSIEEYQKLIKGIYVIEPLSLTSKNFNTGAYGSFYKQLEANAIDVAIRNLNTAFKNFYNGTSKYPKYKDRGYRDPITKSPCLDRVSGGYTTYLSKHALSDYIEPNMDLSQHYVKLTLSSLNKNGLGTVLMRYHRPFPEKCYISQYATVTKNPAGEFYISFVVDITDCDMQTKQKTLDINKSIGIDLSCGQNIFVDSNGKTYNQPHTFQKYEDMLDRYNQQASRMVKGSNNWNKMQSKIAKLHNKIAKKRKGELKKTIDTLLSQYDFIFIENLNVAEMKKKTKIIEDEKLKEQNKPVPVISDKELENLTKCYRSKIQYYLYEFEVRKLLRGLIQDSDIGFVVHYLIERAEKLGKVVRKVPRYYASTQTCSSCGTLNPDVKGLLNVKEKTFVCPCCKLQINRDENAAKNILAKGLLDWNKEQTKAE